MRPTFAKAVLVLAAILAATPCVVACTASPALEAKLRAQPDADTYVELGDWFGDHKQYPCALDAFQSALKLEPGNAKVYYLVGLTLYASGHSQDAIQPLEQSVRLTPEKLEWHILLAHALVDAHHPQEALGEWEAALKIDRHSPEALDGLCKLLIAQGDYASVIELLKDSPHNETLSLDLALAYGMDRGLDKAEQVLTQAMKQNPSSLALTAALVKIYVNQVHYENAVNLAAKSARIHPGNLEAQKLYLQVLVLNGDLALAQPLGRKLLAAHPHDSEFLYLSGVIEFQGGQFAAARQHLEESVALDPKHYNAHYNLGLVLAELKDFPAAREHLERAIALGATEPQVHFKLSTVLRALGENDRAQDELKLYQQLTQARISRTLAASKSAEAAKEQAAGNLQKAAALYREASDATPDDLPLAFKLALALEATGDTTAERIVLERVIKADPAFALAQNQLGYLDSKDGDSADAEQHFRLAVRAAPGYTQAWISLAATLGMESRFPDAQEAVANALKLEPANSEALQLRKDLNTAQGPH